MIRRRDGRFLTLVVVLGLLATLYAARRWKTPSAAAPATGIDSSEFVYEPEDMTEKVVRFYQERVERDPIDTDPPNKLAAAYMQRARETGDIAYYERAQKVLRLSLDILPEENNYPAVALSAAAFFAVHQFETARGWAQKAVALKPREGYAYGQLGDAYLELGEYKKASAAYDRMIRLRQGLYSYSRLSRFKDLIGDTEGAIKSMREAVEAGRRSSRTARENFAWCLTQLGTLYFNTGDLKQAEEQYQAALQTLPRYRLALAGLAKVRTAHTNYPEAIALYQKAVASVPDPQIVALLGDVYAQIGQLDEAKKQYELVEYIGTLARLNRTIYNRPLAIFYADHDRNLPEALGLAQKELEIRKDIYGYDALAWALYKNGRYEDALEAIKKALRLGTKEAIFYYHAGMIQARLGLEKEAAASLKRALEINPYFHLRQAEEARAMLMRKDIVEVTSGRRE